MAIEAIVGARVGEYILVKKLGEGGMAEVWLARHYTSAQLRAIKFLNRQFQGIPEVEARFQTEGESQLIHPNIVRIYQVGQETGSSYLVMDYIDGRDLEKILDSRRGPLTVPEAIDIAMQILAGLGFAHASGIIHRDIKPSNVLVDREGQAYLMDFGIAKALRASRSVTQVNSRLGTPDYMSPEQIRNPRDVDRRSDIYSFGCLFYELLTGWPPFDRGAGYETEHDIKTAHVTELPTPPVERKSNLPAELNDITLHCLAKVKEDRPQSCEDIAAALDAYRASIARTQQPVRNVAVVDTPKPSTGPGAPQRRETVVIQPNQPPTTFPSQPGIVVPSGFGNQSRTPTVADEALFGTRPVMPEQAQKPYTQPPVTTHVPPVVVPPDAGKNGSTKGMQKLLLAIGSVFLLVALGGGAWAIFHKEPPPKEDTVGKNDGGATTNGGSTNSGGGTTSGGGTAANVGTQQSGDSTTHPPNPIKSDGNGGGPKVAPKPINHPKTNTDGKNGIDGQTEQITPPIPPKLASGTIVWTGDGTAVGKHVTIIRSMSAALQGGQVSGPMFPAKPVRVTVRSGNAIVSQPNARTNYNSMDLFLAGPGQQTIVMDWKELPNP